MIRAIPFALIFALAASAGETTDERLRSLEEQNREILERLRQSEAESKSMKSELERTRDEQARHLSAEVEEYLGATAEAQGDRGLLTKSGAMFEFYGFLRFDLYYDTARASNIIIPTTVAAENGVAADRNNEGFAFDVRLTRFGFNFNFGEVGKAEATGKLEVDFANFPSGVPESRETPRIRLAYINIENDRWRLRMGQDWDIISPYYPSANNETLMWNAGNLGDRRPMIAFTFKGSENKLQLTIAAGLTGAINNQDLDAPTSTSPGGPFTVTERDGFDAGHPHGQVRAQYTGEGKWVVGIMGLAGAFETDLAFGGKNSFTFWAVGFDFKTPIGEKVTLFGELWLGEGLGDIRGTIGQAMNTTTGQMIAGYGGFLEAQFAANETWTFLVGGSIDDPDDADVPGSSPNLNLTAYAGTRYRWTKTMQSGFDVIFWETQYGGTTGLGNMLRFNFFTIVNF